MERMILLLGLVVSFSSVSAAQENDTYKWFPYKTGDMWEYAVYQAINLPPDTAQIINTKDSVAVDGRILLTQYQRFINPIIEEYFLPYAIDTANAQVFQLFQSDPRRDPNVPIYKFNAQQGDKWVLYDHNYSGVGGPYEMARVAKVFEGILFGRNTTFMQFHYYYALDSTDTLGSPSTLSRKSITLAKGFGVVARFPSEGGRHYFLKGAVINGRLYGDTTNVITSVLRNPTDVPPKEFALYQNYPNPFNPKTSFEFQVLSSKLVSIKVFDLLGREVATLVNEELMPGRYRTSWDAADMPSGVYFYRMQAGNFSVTKKMTLAK
jgi:hypothetical protein